MKVRLVVDSFRAESGRKRRGDVFDAEGAELKRVLKQGIAVDAAEAADDSDVKVDSEPSEAPAVDEVDESAPERPLIAANRAAWDAYSTAVGVDPSKFKSKDELIAALP